jgi:lipoate synthase
VATPPEDCPNPSGHHRTVLLPVEPTEWGKILSAASERGFRRVEIGQPDRSSRSTTTIAAVVEHRP